MIASYIFYAAWNPPYVLILAFSTGLDWWLARLIDKSKYNRKSLLIGSMVSNLALLGYFKYGGFILENFQSFAKTVGILYQPPELDIILPIGISFYTFASLSYVIDVYRKEIKANASFIDYALFVSFFPHLVAGPIVRAKLLLPQLAQPRNASPDQLGWGLILVVIGLFSKIVLADHIFSTIVDEVYSSPEKYNAIDTWTAIFSFSGQIFYDFSGYSLCAIGLALCFGFEFPDNFRYPYAASGFADFWRRWHISLSMWLRDYLYIPLGGNRRGAFYTYRNLLITMLIGGLWHGATWMFVFWGSLHGIYLAIERTLQNRNQNREFRQSFAAIAMTFMVITLTWIPFRAPAPGVMVEILKGLVRWDANSNLDQLGVLLATAGISLTFLWHILLRSSSLEAQFGKIGRLSQILSIAICMLGIFLCSGGSDHAFIYFQF